MQASLHGIDLKGSSQEDTGTVELSEEQKLGMEKHRTQALERISKRHGQ